jgi:Mg-chelatase subunit ChlD
MVLRRAIALVALTAALTALALGGCAQAPLAESVDAHGRSLVLLLDASASMAENDPDRNAVQGAALAVALAGQHDNVGVIAYNAYPKVLVPLRPSGPAASREAIRAALDQVGTSGATDFISALDAAYRMLDQGHAPSGSCAVMLTDGLPTGRVNRLREFAHTSSVNLTIPDSVPRFAARGWRIFAIVFGSEVAESRSYLAQLTGPTGGSVLEARDATGLVAAFESVSVQALGYLSAERLEASESLALPPGTRRLALLGRFESAGDLGTISCDGAPVNEQRLVRFPRNAPFAVALLEDPAPGRYTVDASGAQGGLTLIEPGWVIELDPQAPPSVVDGGSRVPVSVRVRGDESAIGKLGSSLRLELEVRRSAQVLARVPLARSASRGPADLRFEGAFLAPSEAEPITVEAIATASEGGKSFEQRRSLAVSVRKGAGAAAQTARLSVSAPATFTGFEGDAMDGSVSLEGDPDSALVVTLAAPRGFSATPSRLELPAKGRATVALHAASDASSGTLHLSVAPATAGVAPFTRDVSLSVERGSVTRAVDLGSVAPGEKARATVESSGALLSARAPLSLEGSTLVLDTAGLKPGPFSGSIEARCGAGTRTVAVTAKVASRLPDKLVVQASWGWTSTIIDAGTDGATLELEALIHVGTHAHIEPDFDMRTAALGGGRYELKILAPASLPDGRYVGSVTVSAADLHKIMPLTLEVKR